MRSPPQQISATLQNTPMSLIRLSLLASILFGLVSCSSVPPKTTESEASNGEATATQEEQAVATPTESSAVTFPPATIPRAPVSSLLRPTSFASLPGWRAEDRKSTRLHSSH